MPLATFNESWPIQSRAIHIHRGPTNGKTEKRKISLDITFAAGEGLAVLLVELADVDDDLAVPGPHRHPPVLRYLWPNQPPPPKKKNENEDPRRARVLVRFECGD